ncbi:hypothetical protein [Terrisporobacter mayombei]|uniref:2-isopropylmalate synthase n=1 Tax=Terrisporobacter mayombei TaxID=1541 RepID=A0ABY9PZU5_9FIRM|nr:2-isopropylmalate synthase [Terrisporobacter mayombei]
MFNMLIEVGFKEIEIGFPSASKTEYNFLRKLIDEALNGCKKAIVHLYNSTSILQRDVVFNKSKKEIIDIAIEGAAIDKVGDPNFS